MSSHFDIGYFKDNKQKSIRKRIALKRSITNKIIAWELNKKYYDGKRENGYGGFKYDGRWKRFLPKIIKKYKLNKKSKVLDLGCKKSFLIKDLREMVPGIKCYGIENHIYPIRKLVKTDKKIVYSPYNKLKFKRKFFDLVIGFNSIYMQNLGDTIQTLKEIQRVSKNSYVSLASGESNTEISKFYKWTLIGTTILKKKDWIKLFNYIGFKGDYYFSESKKLKL